MQLKNFLSAVTLFTVSLLPLTVKHADAFDLLSNFNDRNAVAFQYSCSNAPVITAAVLSLPTCTTSFTIPSGKRLVILSISGSATPLSPTATGTFPTGQASLSITTQLGADAPVPNLIGPNYALSGSKVWFFTNLLTLYSDLVPVVANLGGPVYIQGYLVSMQSDY